MGQSLEVVVVVVVGALGTNSVNGGETNLVREGSETNLEISRNK